ncbi:phage antirepressor KilAC domain-containing protein [Fischerella sp. PCC 9605]|uniref:phage antirepressor KilAC domain-containing protein n=1 Tax=Fischerella sp. PCC 9605 TaxID=1173024 RepID=UPI00047CED36|nr:phage antirepressor KilAC domain-containing protein [Fischerella sp. PCC 9605]
MSAIGYRAYFQRELQWQPPATHLYKLPQSYSEALRMLADETEAHAKTKGELEEAQPKIILAEDFIEKVGLTSFTQFTNDLNIPRNKFVQWLVDKGYCTRSKSKRKYVRAYSQYRKYILLKPVTITIDDKTEVVPSTY